MVATEGQIKLWENLFPFLSIVFLHLSRHQILTNIHFHVLDIDCVKYVQSFQVWEVKLKCFKPALFQIASRGRLHWFQKVVWLYWNLWENGRVSHLINSLGEQFMNSITHFKSSSTQDEVNCVDYSHHVVPSGSVWPKYPLHFPSLVQMWSRRAPKNQDGGRHIAWLAAAKWKSTNQYGAITVVYTLVLQDHAISIFCFCCLQFFSFRCWTCSLPFSQNNIHEVNNDGR